jgi:hypothetical protein
MEWGSQRTLQVCCLRRKESHSDGSELTMLTIFALPKPFKGHIGSIQRNAISQWSRLRPGPEILLFGDEEGTSEFARELDLRHFPEIERNEFGTPLLSDLFAKANTLGSRELLCYVNADIILLGDFMGAVERTRAWRRRFLMVGQRTNIDLDEPEEYKSADQEARLYRLVREKGSLGGPWAIDYFVFPRSLFLPFPPFAIGRPHWDNWFLWKAYTSNIPLVDASKVILAIHQNHDYSHLPRGASECGRSKEATRNFELAKGAFCTIGDATHQLSENGIEFSLSRSIGVWWRALGKLTAPIRYPLGLQQGRILNLLHKLKA